MWHSIRLINVLCSNLLAHYLPFLTYLLHSFKPIRSLKIRVKETHKMSHDVIIILMPTVTDMFFPLKDYCFVWMDLMDD